MKQREIKFRVWDEEVRRWWCPDSQYLQMDGGKIHAAPWSSLSCDLPNDSIVIQQYTGTKDKNGKEIYEGDIIQFAKNCSTDEFDVGHVWFCDLAGEWVVSMNHLYSEWANPFRGAFQKTIIGNIFENEDLLK